MQRFKKYLLYAIGEIVLVVIGILVAVSINNWNEARKDREKLTTYLGDYRNDLILDSAVVHRNLNLIERMEPVFDLALSDSLDKDNLQENPAIFNLVMSYYPVHYQNKGYNELKNYISNETSKKDTLVQRIVAQHADHQNFMQTTLNNIANDIQDNMSYFKNNEPWFSSFLANDFNDEIVNYFLSKDYSNRVALHKILIMRNLKSALRNYQDYINVTLASLNKRLEK